MKIANFVHVLHFCLLLAIPAFANGADSASIRVHFLGTGGPEITRDRMGASTLIEAGGEMFLFDAGRGVLQRLGESRLNIPAIRKVFFTHLHSDPIPRSRWQLCCGRPNASD